MTSLNKSSMWDRHEKVGQQAINIGLPDYRPSTILGTFLLQIGVKLFVSWPSYCVGFFEVKF